LNDSCAQVEDKEDRCGGGVSGLDKSDRQREEKVTRKDEEQEDSSGTAEARNENKIYIFSIIEII
jgi:hypothetical protein